MSERIDQVSNQRSPSKPNKPVNPRLAAFEAAAKAESRSPERNVESRRRGHQQQESIKSFTSLSSEDAEIIDVIKPVANVDPSSTPVEPEPVEPEPVEPEPVEPEPVEPIPVQPSTPPAHPLMEPQPEPQPEPQLNVSTPHSHVESDLGSPSSTDFSPQIPQRSIGRIVEPESAEMMEAKWQPLKIAKPEIFHNYNAEKTGPVDPESNDNNDKEVHEGVPVREEELVKTPVNRHDYFPNHSPKTPFVPSSASHEESPTENARSNHSVQPSFSSFQSTHESIPLEHDEFDLEQSPENSKPQLTEANENTSENAGVDAGIPESQPSLDPMNMIPMSPKLPKRRSHNISPELPPRHKVHDVHEDVRDNVHDNVYDNYGHESVGHKDVSTDDAPDLPPRHPLDENKSPKLPPRPQSITELPRPVSVASHDDTEDDLPVLPHRPSSPIHIMHPAEFGVGLGLSNSRSATPRAGTGAAAGSGAFKDVDITPTISNEELKGTTTGMPELTDQKYKYVQSPITPNTPEHGIDPPILGVCIVGFHHQRGPEVEYWVGGDKDQSEMWPYLPFQSLPDGSHQFEENICYFTLLYDHNHSTVTSMTFSRDEEGNIKEGTSDFRDVTTLFAIACSRQVDTDELKVSGDENYTRSVVQKSVVVISRKPIFGPIKEKLMVVTRSYFDQRDFNDREIINHFYDSLLQMPLWTSDSDIQVGMHLQRCIMDFGMQTLMILKAMLLEQKILFYATDTDLLGTTQFALISLIPDLINHLEDSGSPLLSSYETKLSVNQFVDLNDKLSVLKYLGFPLQIFAAGGVLAPFVPLQQFEDLKQPETKYGVIGTTNNLFLTEDINFDMIVDIDNKSITYRNPRLHNLVKLTNQDKAFMKGVCDAVGSAARDEESWHPEALGYVGGEDYIRNEFEAYLAALMCTAKRAHNDENVDLHPFGNQFFDVWKTTNNYRIFDRNTDPSMYTLFNTDHPGLKLTKPSGLDKIWGLFKPANHDDKESMDGQGQSQGQSPDQGMHSKGLMSPIHTRTPHSFRSRSSSAARSDLNTPRSNMSDSPVNRLGQFFKRS